MAINAKRDIHATASAGFLHDRSFIALDGREILHGRDWAERKLECFQRDHWTCVICGRRGKMSDGWFDMVQCDHHPVKRSVSRDDRLTNLRTLCPTCHRAEHPEKQPQWSRP